MALLTKQEETNEQEKNESECNVIKRLLCMNV